MTLEILDSAIVVVAKQHNPTILHPAFLASQHIVPEDWELAEDPICTPPFSVVKYKNGVRFTVEGNRLQVSEMMPSKSVSESQVPKLAEKYIVTLKHVNYTAVGINFRAILPHQDNEEYLKRKFISREALVDLETRLSSVSLKLVFPLDEGHLNLSLEPGNTETKGNTTEGIMIRSNYHQELLGENKLESAKALISKFSDRCDHFIQTVNKIFDQEK